MSVLRISKKDYLQHLCFRIIVLMFLSLKLKKYLELTTMHFIWVLNLKIKINMFLGYISLNCWSKLINLFLLVYFLFILLKLYRVGSFLIKMKVLLTFSIFTPLIYENSGIRIFQYGNLQNKLLIYRYHPGRNIRFLGLINWVLSICCVGYNQYLLKEHVSHKKSEA
jgi:hypothetical protein